MKQAVNPSRVSLRASAARSVGCSFKRKVARTSRAFLVFEVGLYNRLAYQWLDALFDGPNQTFAPILGAEDDVVVDHIDLVA